MTPDETAATRAMAERLVVLETELERVAEGLESAAWSFAETLAGHKSPPRRHPRPFNPQSHGEGMTEEEAKTKWCPFARTLGTLSVQVHGIETVVANGPHNRGFAMDGPLTKCLCIASACMAWRWSEAPRTEAYKRAVVEHMKATGDNANKAMQEVLKRRDDFTYTEGYCGLAGAPQ